MILSLTPHTSAPNIEEDMDDRVVPPSMTDFVYQLLLQYIKCNVNSSMNAIDRDIFTTNFLEFHKDKLNITRYRKCLQGYTEGQVKRHDPYQFTLVRTNIFFW